MNGFVGTFTKRDNLNFNKHDKRTGGKYIRHTNMTRGEIVLYNVRTWVDRKLLAERAADKLPPQVHMPTSYSHSKSALFTVPKYNQGNFRVESLETYFDV